MKLILPFFITLLCISANAQITFERGYYIKNNQEKISCFIKNVDWKDNPVKFEYKIALSDNNTETATVAEVSEFSIDGESKYKRFDVTIERSDIILNNLTENKNPVWQKETLFLKVLVEGDASLYCYSEGNLLKLFYATETVPVEQLVAITYKSPEGNVATSSIFRQQLFNNVKRNNMEIADFKNIEYTTPSLIRHFEKYNNSNTHKASTYLTKKQKTILNIRVTAGVTSAKLSINNSSTYNSLSTDISKTILHFGAEMEYILPFNKNKWAIVINPTYQKFDAEKNYITTIPGFPPQDVEHNANVKYTSIDVPFGLRYYLFLNKTSKIYINALYSINFSQSSSISFIDSSHYTINSSSNAAVGLGYTFKDRYSLEARINSPREILNDYLQWSAKYITFNIQLGYKVF